MSKIIGDRACFTDNLFVAIIMRAYIWSVFQDVITNPARVTVAVRVYVGTAAAVMVLRWQVDSYSRDPVA